MNTFSSLDEVRKGVAINLLDIWLIGAQFEVGLHGVVLHEIVFMGDGP